MPDHGGAIVDNGKHDPAARKGIHKAIDVAFGLAAKPLLLDQASDQAFATMIDRLRGEPGSNKGKLA